MRAYARGRVLGVTPMVQGAGGGRPMIELSAEQKIQIEALAQYLSQEQISDYLGISQDTFQRIIKRDEDVAIRYRRGKATAIGAIAQSLTQKAIAGDFKSQDLFLRTQGGWNTTLKNEHVSPDGSMTPKADGPVAIYALPDNGRDKVEPEPVPEPKPKRKPRSKPKAKATRKPTGKPKPKAATPRKKGA